MIKRSLFLMIILVALAFGCAAEPTPTLGPTATPAPPQPVDTSRVGGFAAYVPAAVDVTPDATVYVPDLTVVANADAIAGLSDAQRAALEQNGFFVVPVGYEQVYQIYQQAQESSVPALVTTDSVLHAASCTGPPVEA